TRPKTRLPNAAASEFSSAREFSSSGCVIAARSASFIAAFNCIATWASYHSAKIPRNGFVAMAQIIFLLCRACTRAKFHRWFSCEVLVQSAAPRAKSALRRQRGQSKSSQRNLFFGGALGLMIQRHQPPSRTPASDGVERWLGAAAKSLPNRHISAIRL